MVPKPTGSRKRSPTVRLEDPLLRALEVFMTESEETDYSRAIRRVLKVGLRRLSPKAAGVLDSEES